MVSNVVNDMRISNMIHGKIALSGFFQTLANTIGATDLFVPIDKNLIANGDVKMKDKNGNDIVILKIQKTCKRKYGVKSFTQSKIFIDKSKNTRYIKNNGRYESKETRQKNINTCLLKYGVVNGGGSRQAQLKMHKKYYYLNKYFDSSWELEYFIYLTDNNIKFEYQPNISFKYYVDNKEYTYFPDFIVNNEIIELKGDQFFKEDGTMYCPTANGVECSIASSDTCILSKSFK